MSTIRIKKSEINRTIRLITINFQNFIKIKLNLTYFNAKRVFEYLIHWFLWIMSQHRCMHMKWSERVMCTWLEFIMIFNRKGPLNLRKPYQYIYRGKAYEELNSTKLEWKFYVDPFKSYTDHCPLIDLDHWPIWYGYRWKAYDNMNSTKKVPSHYHFSFSSCEFLKVLIFNIMGIGKS